MKVLFATAELRPHARVGGLAEAAAGLVRELVRLETEVTVVLPDYGGLELTDQTTTMLATPEWTGAMTARRGSASDGTALILVGGAGLERPHPYVDPENGMGWTDNDHRFFAFSAAIAALTIELDPDVLHLNDWHTAATLGFLADPPPTMLTIHTLGYQGVADRLWLDRIPVDPWRFAWYEGTNPLLGAIRSADTVVAVSPNYAREILTAEQGMGLHQELAAIGDRLVGIRNGIDAEAWDPATDPALSTRFALADGGDAVDAARADARRVIDSTFGLDEDDDGPIIAMVTRLVDQKGVDLALALVPYLEHLRLRLVILGSGQADLTRAVEDAVAQAPDRVAAVLDRYDEELAHQMFAGSDLFLMPSRFEPCGLAQMQAMAYGSIPVATAVGGLVDTVIDDDEQRGRGTGFLAARPDPLDLLDALHRATKSLSHRGRRRAIQQRGMTVDWSWHQPALAHLAHYRALARGRSTGQDQSNE